MGSLFGLGRDARTTQILADSALADALGATPDDPRPVFGLAAMIAGFAPEECRPPMTPGMRAVVDALLKKEKRGRGRPALNGRWSVDEKRAWIVLGMNLGLSKPLPARHWIREIQAVEVGETLPEKEMLFPPTTTLARLEQSVSRGVRGLRRRGVERAILAKKSG
jgi:hypothetical protein